MNDIDIIKEKVLLDELKNFFKEKKALISKDFLTFSFLPADIINYVFEVTIDNICSEFNDKDISDKFRILIEKNSFDFDLIFRLIGLQKHSILTALEYFDSSISKVIKAVKVVDIFYIKLEKAIYFILKEFQSKKLENQNLVFEQKNQMMYTKSIEDENNIFEAEARFRSLVNATSQVVWHGDINGNITEDYTELNWLNVVHPDDKAMVIKRWNEAIKNKAPVEIEYRVKNQENYAFVVVKGVPVFDKDNNIKEWIGTVTDISQKKITEFELKEEININQILYRIGKVISAELDLNKLIQKITEESKLISGAEYSVFIYRTDENTDYAYAFSGIKDQDYDSYINNIESSVLKRIFKNKNIIRIDDINELKIEENILKIIPSEYNLRSCLILPIISVSGKISGVLLVGSTKSAIFTVKDERILSGICSQASIIIDNARLYQESRNSEANFRMLAQAIPEIIWTANNKGEKEYFNENWYKYTGLSDDGSYGMNWLNAIHPDDRERKLTSWLNSVNTGKDYEIICRIRSQQDNYRWFLTRAIPFKNEDGEIIKWFGSSTDIDDQKKTQDKLDNTVIELKQFAFISSHDLQEPLRAISSYIQLLQKKYKGKIDQEAEDFIKYSIQGVNRLQSLIEDLLVYSNLIQREVVAKTINLNDIIPYVLGELKTDIEKSNAVISFSDLPVIMGNSSEMILLFKNLISNSIKYSIIDPKIHIKCDLKHGDWIIKIKDNGIGIKKDYFDKIFLMFQRLHSREEYPGTGMGLAICKKIVERHKGNIWLKSELGKGTEFIFSLPKI